MTETIDQPISQLNEHVAQLFRQGRYQEALPLAQQANARAAEQESENSLDLAESFGNLSDSFIAEAGTAITAAASGTVVYAGTHPQYGKMIDIDHGNGLVSRYAHASRLFVSEGDLVIRGQKVAAVGTTGRSTGPHLHFEVRLEGVPQNPARFLNAAR